VQSRWSRAGLRTRLIASFALGALLLSTVLALTALELSRAYLLAQREDSALRQAYVNAAFIRDGLREDELRVSQLLRTLDSPDGSQSVLEQDGRWYATSLDLGRAALPVGLRSEVGAGTPARQVFSLDGDPVLVVGVPLPEVRATYFEAFRLSNLDATLSTLTVVLGLTGLGASALGAGFGWATSRRVLAPVSSVAQGAAEIAAGRLSTRLPTQAKGELGLLVSSFNGMADALERRVEREARFAADVSHELRSPLTTLRTSVDVLDRRREEMPGRTAEVVSLIRAELDRFERLVQDLLEMARLDAGQISEHPEPVLLAELLGHVAADRPGGLPLEIDDSARAVAVTGSKRRLEQVVRNLVDNADSHGDGVSRVHLSADPECLRLVVEDCGPGIPDEAKEAVFARFSRGGGAGSRAAESGSGLGLALVEEHVRLHSGRVSVGDRPGGGARFLVEIPRTRVEADA
jgi:two-component system, OmpR family, sensor histidine kinase MtrB